MLRGGQENECGLRGLRQHCYSESAIKQGGGSSLTACSAWRLLQADVKPDSVLGGWTGRVFDGLDITTRHA